MVELLLRINSKFFVSNFNGDPQSLTLPANANTVIIEVWGGGSGADGGGSGGSGGSGAAYAKETFTGVGGQTLTIYVGNGGRGGHYDGTSGDPNAGAGRTGATVRVMVVLLAPEAVEVVQVASMSVYRQ